MPTLAVRRAVLYASAFLALVAIAPTAMAADTKVPDELKKAGEFRVGVKCDAPPFGYMDEQGKPTGIDVDFSRYVAEKAFGDPEKATFTCVTSATRIQMLTSGKIDFIIATLGVTDERKKSVDYATSTNWSGSGVLVKSDGPYSGFTKLEEFDGKELLTNKGSLQAEDIEKNHPNIKLTKFDNLNDAIMAFRQGRGDGVTQDNEPLIAAAEKDPSVKLAGISFAIGWAAPAVRRHDEALRLFMNDMVTMAKKEGVFEASVGKYTSAGVLRDMTLKGYVEPPADGSSDQNTVLP